MMRRKIAATMLAAIMFSLCGNASAWNGISHYHINRGVSVEPGSIFGINGTGPDMSVQWLGKDPKIPDENNKEQKWPDCFHSPNPKYEDKERPYADKPNFAYLMLKTSEKNGLVSDSARARALGWGGHIAADWVAHNDNLFPICPTGSSGEKKHFIGECLCELYSFLTKGSIGSINDLSASFDDKQIYKSLYNYRLISIHENLVEQGKSISDKELKETTLQTTLPRSCIRERIKRWVAKLAVIQFAYSCGIEAWNPIKRSLFLSEMEGRGVMSNISLSEMSVNAWINNTSPRGHIPDYSNQVVPFYSQKLMDIPTEASLSKISASKSSASFAKLQSPAYRASQMEELSQDSGPAMDEKDLLFWQSIIDAACQEKYVVVDEAETADGLYQVDVSINNRDGLRGLIKEKIQTSKDSDDGTSNPARIWGNLLVDGITDPGLLTDSIPPSIGVVSPCEGSFVNTAMPSITARVEDVSGIGIDRDKVFLYLDNELIRVNFNGSLVDARPVNGLKEGMHRVIVRALDRAGNETRAEWSFCVDTVAPKLCYKVKNRVINGSGRKVEVAIVPNESVNYLLTAYPVIDDRPAVDMVIFQKKYDPQKVLSWNGTCDNGLKAAPGDYEVRISAIDRAGNKRTLKINARIEK